MQVSIVLKMLRISFDRKVSPRWKALSFILIGFILGMRLTGSYVKKDSNKIMKTSKMIPLYRYSRADFELDVAKDRSALDHCKEIDAFGEPHHFVCIYPENQDVWVSGSFWQGESWEMDVTLLILELAGHLKNDIVYLDLGANIGSHSIPVAKRGVEVWAVEPVTPNILRLFHSATLSEIGENLHLLKNILDNERGEMIMNIDSFNKGASNVFIEGSSDGLFHMKEVVNSVLLSDVFDEIMGNRGDAPVSVVLKVDIEHHECRVFLSSAEQFRREDLFVAFIIMEWTFSGTICSEDRVKQLGKMFVVNGYTAYSHHGVLLNVETCDDWDYGTVVWVHNKMAAAWPKKSIL